jgi:lipopolysaccharide transport system ATP-binding protein
VSEVAVRVDHVTKSFRLYHERNQSLKSAIMRRRRSIHEDFLALEDVSFDVPAGSTFGLIGSNGSGKSTLLKCLANIYYPNKGSGFHAELSGRENVFLNGSILGMSRKEVTRKFDEIVDFSGVEQFIDQPVKNYSSGMYVRLGFAIAINVDPDILVVDEVLAVGDQEFQDKCFQKFTDFKKQGKTVILVSHSMQTVQTMCDHVAWLNHGELKAVGAAEPTIKSYIDSLHSGE